MEEPAYQSSAIAGKVLRSANCKPNSILIPWLEAWNLITQGCTCGSAGIRGKCIAAAGTLHHVWRGTNSGRACHLDKAKRRGRSPTIFPRSLRPWAISVSGAKSLSVVSTGWMRRLAAPIASDLHTRAVQSHHLSRVHHQRFTLAPPAARLSASNSLTRRPGGLVATA